MVKILEITDNSGVNRKVYANLNVGDKLKSKQRIIGKDDFGASGIVFDYDAFKPEKIYEVRMIYRWDGVSVGYVVDESGTLHFATPEIFDVII